MNGSSNANPFQYYVDYQDEILEQFSHFVKPDSHDVVILVLFGILFLASIFGNSMVCMAVIFQREMRTVTNFYIVNLAVADLLVSLICLPLNAMNGVSMSWFLGQPMCKFLGFFTVSVIAIYQAVSIKYLSSLGTSPIIPLSTQDNTSTSILRSYCNINWSWYYFSYRPCQLLYKSNIIEVNTWNNCRNLSFSDSYSSTCELTVTINIKPL